MCRIIALFICFASILSAEENPSVLYISQYKEIAIAEMERSGIPASIKMAQALLESGAGRSTLAKEANNHFGIKCGGQWNGKTFYRKDDDYNSKGELIKSCFRKFKSPDDSFRAHTEFLTTQNRYAFLFEYDKSDYHKWAYGLKKAGYATDNAYPNKLISLIEKYELFLLDQEVAIVAEHNAENVVNDKKNSVETKSNPNKRNKDRSDIVTTNQKKKRSQNQRSSDVATVEKSDRNSSRSKKASKRQKSKNTSTAIYHIVNDNETIASIAKRHGVKENALRLRNRIPKNAEPLPGEKIYLRKKIRLLERPQYTAQLSSNSRQSNDKFIF